MIRVPATSDMSDVNLGKHLDSRHVGQTAGVKWRGQPVNETARRMWEQLHQRLHRTEPQEHKHADERPWNGEDASMPGGVSILEKYWQELDDIMDRLIEKSAGEHDVGRAQGVAWCLAVMTSPYNPDVEKIRQEAVRRRQGREKAE